MQKMWENFIFLKKKCKKIAKICMAQEKPTQEPAQLDYAESREHALPPPGTQIEALKVTANELRSKIAEHPTERSGGDWRKIYSDVQERYQSILDQLHIQDAQDLELFAMGKRMHDQDVFDSGDLASIKAEQLWKRYSFKEIAITDTEIANAQPIVLEKFCLHSLKIQK